MSDNEVAKGARFVTVRCKHPNGLLLRLFKLVDHDVPTPGGVKTEKLAEVIAGPIKINGNRVPLNQDGTEREIDYLIVGGYALTPNVDADFMKEWFSQNKDHPMVKNGLIAVHTSEDAARAASRDSAKTISGLEPLVPDTEKRRSDDPRIPRRADGRSAVTTAAV